MNYIASYDTNKGLKKETNQDSLLLKIAGTPFGQVVFAVVCDGMGGLNKGELASKEVILAFDQWFHFEFPKLLKEKWNKKLLEEQWRNLLNQLNVLLLEYGEENDCHIGTTITAVLFIEKRYYILHVGDCRVYEIKNELNQLTIDHTLVQKEVQSGVLTKKEACTDRRKNILLQSVGAVGKVEPDFIEGMIEENAVYLLCSDGFRNKVEEVELYQKLNPERLSDTDIIKNTIHTLIQLVMKRKETDNITAIVIRTF